MKADTVYDRVAPLQAADLERGVLDALKAHIAVLDEEGTIIKVNRAWETFALANLPVDRARVGVGSNYLDVCPCASKEGSEAAALFADGIRSVRAGRQDRFELEYTCHSPEERRWFVGRVTRFGAGDALRIVVAHENITARKLAEEELSRSRAVFQDMREESLRGAAALRHMEQRFSEVMRNVSLIGVMLDTQGNISFCNDFVLELTGWQWKEVEGKSWFDLFLPADVREDVRSYYFRSLAEGQICPHYQNEIYTRHGVRRAVIWSNTFLRDPDGRVGGIASLGEDITERQWAEQMRQESEALNRAIVDTAADAIITIDERSVIESFNAAAVQMYGYEAAEIVGQDIRTLMPEGSEDRYNQYVTMFLNTPEPNGLKIRREGIGRRKDGTLFPLEFAASAVQAGSARHYTAILRDVTERTQANAVIQRQFERLTALRSIDSVITSSLDLRLTLRFLIDQTLRLLCVDAACMLLRDAHTHRLEFACGKGFRFPTRSYHSLRIGLGQADRAALERRVVHIPDMRESDRGFINAPTMAQEGFVAYLAMPLIAKDQVVGVLEIYHRAPLVPDEEWCNFLETLAGQAAMAVDNSMLFESMQRTNEELTVAYDATIEGWSRALDLRDKETEGHSQRVTDMTLHLARAVGVSVEEVVHIRRGALLHDIGKMGIPDSILLKPGTLTEDEWRIMRKHPEYAHEMLYPIVFLRPALDIPLCHHEKWDGSGYPNGLKGEQIPLAARIFAVADVWDALSSNRPYRQAWPMDRVREHLQAMAGTHFDPLIVALFLNLRNI